MCARNQLTAPSLLVASRHCIVSPRATVLALVEAPLHHDFLFFAFCMPPMRCNIARLRVYAVYAGPFCKMQQQATYAVLRDSQQYLFSARIYHLIYSANLNFFAPFIELISFWMKDRIITHFGLGNNLCGIIKNAYTQWFE